MAKVSAQQFFDLYNQQKARQGSGLQQDINQIGDIARGFYNQGQTWMGNAGNAYGGMGNVAGQLQNWNAQNPYQNMLMGALQGMGQGGFNAGQLGQFMNAFNPNSQGYGGWGNMPSGGGGGNWMNPGAIGGVPITGGGMKMGFDNRYRSGGGMPSGPSGIAPMAPGAGQQPTAGQGRNMQQGMVGGNAGMPPQPPGATNPFGVNLNQAPPMNTLGGFLNQQSNVPQPQQPGFGAGGQFMNQLFGGGTQAPGQFGGFGQDVGTARGAQLGGLLSQAQGIGISPEQKQQLFSAQFDPVQQAIEQSARGAQTGLSARGMGRSSEALGNIERSKQAALGTAAQQIGAGLTQQDLDLAQRQREFGLGGLGGYAQTGISGALGAGGLQNQLQGTANQYNLGLGNLGLGGAGLQAQTGLEMNQQQMAAQNQQFNQDNARAGLDLARYQTQQGFNMDQYRADLGAAVQRGQLDEQTAARLGQQALQTMGYGLEAQGMQNANQQALVNALLGAGNQALGYGGQNLQALQGAGSLYGNMAGQAGNLGMGLYGMYMDPLQRQIAFQNQRGLSREQQNAQGGGIGGFLGGLAGMGLGSFLGPIGAIGGKYVGNQIFGGGGQQTPVATTTEDTGWVNRNWQPWTAGGGYRP